MIRPLVEDPAADSRALTLVHQVWIRLDDLDRVQFNDYLIGALAADLPAKQMATSIRIAEACMAREAAERGEPSDLDHDHLTDAAQDGWDR